MKQPNRVQVCHACRPQGVWLQPFVPLPLGHRHLGQARLRFRLHRRRAWAVRTRSTRRSLQDRRTLRPDDDRQGARHRLIHHPALSRSRDHGHIGSAHCHRGGCPPARAGVLFRPARRAVVRGQPGYRLQRGYPRQGGVLPRGERADAGGARCWRMSPYWTTWRLFCRCRASTFTALVRTISPRALAIPVSRTIRRSSRRCATSRVASNRLAARCKGT